jgi:hypothetical protein
VIEYTVRNFTVLLDLAFGSGLATEHENDRWSTRFGNLIFLSVLSWDKCFVGDHSITNLLSDVCSLMLFR